jgi:aminoglycoside phosphotransferase (APT) family kinase protein
VALPGGQRNESYLVNDRWVLRVNTRDPQFAKFRNERAAYALVAPFDLPVPTVVVLDEGRTLVPYDYIILTRLPGTSVAASRATLTPAQGEGLAYAAGECLARLHGITLPGFGKLSERDQHPFPTWPAFFNDYVQRYLGPACAAGLLDPALAGRLDRALTRAQPLLARVTPGVLVHSDFHYANLLQADGRLVGILDFEWALAGDPTTDFMAEPARAVQLPGSAAAFLAGYQATRAFDREHAPRLAVYRLFLALEDAVTAHRWGDHASVRAALATMQRRLPGVEAGEGRAA